jgi:hypothetical protein
LFFVAKCKELLLSEKTMDCDRSALLKKAIKATARRLKNKHTLAVAFFAFWAFMIVIDIFNY